MSLRLRALPYCLIALFSLSGCGSDADAPATDSNSQSANVTAPLPEQEASSPSSILTTKVHGVKASQAQPLPQDASNARGQFNYPVSGTTHNSNLTLSVDAEDSDGINQLYLAFPDSQQALPLCQSNCGGSQHQTETGINPALYGISPGNVTIELWIQDALDNQILLDAITLNWQPRTIDTISVDRTDSTIELNWSPLDDYLRYNVYLASERGITPANIDSFEDGEVVRSLEQSRLSVPTDDPDQLLFALISGVDGSGESAFSDIIMIKGTSFVDNLDPNAIDDDIVINEDTPVTVNVLNNDSDPEGDPLTLAPTLVSPPTHGEVSLTDSGEVNYQPDSNFFGTDQFQYRVNDDQQGTATATVQVQIRPVNDAPVANDDAFSLDEDTTLTVQAPGLLGNDEDIDSDNLTIDMELVTPPGFGDVSVSADGSFRYTPDDNHAGEDSFRYRVVDDDNASDTATVTLTVAPKEDAPIAVNDQYEVSEDTTLTVSSPGLLGNDRDPDGDSLLINQLLSEPQNGTLNISENGGFSYIPDANFYGREQFTYEITDGQLTAAAEVTVEVIPANDPPMAINDTATTNEDIAVTIDVLSNDSDVDGDTLTITSATAQTGDVSIIENQLTYSPATNVNGNDSLSYSITDGQGGTDSASVSVNVEPVNDAPTAINDTATTNEDTAVTIDVLSNDSDVDGDTLTITSATAQTGGVSIIENQLTYSPATNVNGNDSLSYSITDGQGGTDSASVSVNVEPVNDAPTAINDTATTNEDIAVTIDVLSNDSDVDGDTLTITSATAQTGDVSIIENQLTYSPATNFNGTDSLSYSISDDNGGSDSASVSVTIVPVNDVPVANDDTASTASETSVTIDVLSNDTDVDNDPLTVSSASATNGNVSIEQDQTLIYLPDTGFSGSDTLSYSISDGNGGSDSATVAIDVTGSVNTAPFADADNYDLSAQGTHYGVVAESGVLSNDSDEDNDELTATLVEGPSQASSFSLNSDGSFDYVHDGSVNTNDSFTYVANDGSDTSSDTTVSLSISPNNIAPSICSTPPLHARVGEQLKHFVTAVDRNSDTPTYSSSGLPAWLSLNTVSGIGELSGTPATANLGDITSMTLSAEDSVAQTDQTWPRLRVVDRFGTDGYASHDIGGNDKVTAAALDNRGRIVISGKTFNGTSDDTFVARLSPDGSLDTSFNGSGVNIMDIAAANGAAIGSDDGANDIVVDPLGRIILVGFIDDGNNGSRDFAVTRLNDNGTVDTDFAGNGYFSLDDGYDEMAESVLLSDNGEIQVLGKYIPGGDGISVGLFRLDTTGSLDTSIGNSGLVNIGNPSIVGSPSLGNAHFDDEGHIYAVGSDSSLSTSNIFIARVADGEPDSLLETGSSGLSDNGYFLHEQSATEENASDFTFNKEGELLVVGEQDGDVGLFTYEINYHVNDNNYSISHTGSQTFDNGGTEQPRQIIADGQGNYYILASSGADTIILKYDGSGLDTSFGNSGILSLDQTTASEHSPALLTGYGDLLTLLSPDGDVDSIETAIADDSDSFSCNFVATNINGYSNDDQFVTVVNADSQHYYGIGTSETAASLSPVTGFALSKFNQQGQLNTSFAHHGRTLHLHDSAAVSLTATNAGTTSTQDLIVAGYTDTSGLYMAKFNVSGDLDNSFNTNGIADYSGSISGVPKALHINTSDNSSLVLMDDSGSVSLYQLDSSGNLDTSFGADGSMSTADNDGSTPVNISNTTIAGMSVDDNGRIYLGGKNTGTDDIQLIRFTANGLLDSGFGDNGVVTVTSSPEGQIVEIAEYNNAIYTLLNYATSEKTELLKLDASTEALDSNFAAQGIKAFSDTTASNGQLAVDNNNGEIYIKALQPTTNHHYLFKLTSDGSFDATALNGGNIALNSHLINSWDAIRGFALKNSGDQLALFGELTDSGQNDWVMTMMETSGLVQQQGAYQRLAFGEGDKGRAAIHDGFGGTLLSGSILDNSDYSANGAIIRLDSSGSLDTGFDSSDDAFTLVDANDISIPAIDRTASNKILIQAGPTADQDSLSGDTDLSIQRASLTAPATPDSDFANGGLSLDIDNGSTDAAIDQLNTNNGETFVLAEKNDLPVVIKIDSKGVVATDFGSSGVTLLETDTSVSPMAIAQDHMGNIMVAGHRLDGTATEGVIYVIDSATGTLNNDFSGDGIIELNSGSRVHFNDITTTANGQLVVTGEDNGEALVAVFDRNGSLETQHNYDGGDNTVGQALARDPFGGLVMAVQINNQVTLLRLNDAATDEQPSAPLLPHMFNRITDISLDRQGNALVTGTTHKPGTGASFLTIKFRKVYGAY